jgi:DNA polymerase-3 subunit gamma/tau
MRDALSILDKIVSFTNGELTYKNTLEHLNILDADYYFQLLEAMQQQNLADALLIYDDINRKGFEGDLVLNGLAEFIRNLLVCKDEKVASLLEAVESFRERYVSVGKKVDAVYLVSALNVLNESEINYKSARNKRLHVELALIKLSYLAQAMHVIAGETGDKKKQAEQLRPVSFRNIPAIEPVGRGGRKEETAPAGAVAPGASGAKLIVEEGIAAGAVKGGGYPGKRPVEGPVDIRSESAERGLAEGTERGEAVTKFPAEKGNEQEVKAPAAGSLKSLSKIRQQFADRSQGKEGSNSRSLEVEALHKAWQQYADYLRENRNPAVQSLELATLRIIDGNSFEVVTSNNLEQKFIEQEKRGLSDHLQQVFENKSISFAVIVEEKASVEEPGEKPLNKREQFQQIVEQYPLVKELKDRLRLELDY